MQKQLLKDVEGAIPYAIATGPAVPIDIDFSAPAAGGGVIFGGWETKKRVILPNGKVVITRQKVPDIYLPAPPASTMSANIPHPAVIAAITNRPENGAGNQRYYQARADVPRASGSSSRGCGNGTKHRGRLPCR